ncbi:hypothetical protein [Streptomyces nigrescens]|uniref:hypothetical protein n=1 Tax=Streptomyces nigrescens TaxID=1920 RepID=UPI0036FEF1E3
MSDSADNPSPEALAAVLREPVRAVLRARADALRRNLPARSRNPAGNYIWWTALNADQARRATLMDHLDMLCAHLDGQPALGYDPRDPLPSAALEAVEGFACEEISAGIADYRRALRRRQAV